jgi:hypothetical protein
MNPCKNSRKISDPRWEELPAGIYSCGGAKVQIAKDAVILRIKGRLSLLFLATMYINISRVVFDENADRNIHQEGKLNNASGKAACTPRYMAFHPFQEFDLTGQIKSEQICSLFLYTKNSVFEGNLHYNDINTQLTWNEKCIATLNDAFDGKRSNIEIRFS